jgi:hypothetical protein
VEEPFLSSIEYNDFYDVRQTEIQTAEQLVPEISAFNVAMGIGNLKRHKSPGIDYISAELIKTGGRRIRSEIHTGTHTHIATYQINNLTTQTDREVVTALSTENGPLKMVKQE